MAKVHITTNEGELIEQIDLSEWGDLSPSFVRAALTEEIWSGIDRATKAEDREED